MLLGKRREHRQQELCCTRPVAILVEALFEEGEYQRELANVRHRIAAQFALHYRTDALLGL